jgi:hypothetical protein
MCGHRDQAGTAGVPLGLQAAGAPSQLEIARDGGAAHGKDAGGFALAHATLDGMQNLGTEVKGVGVHTFSLPLTQSHRKML